jgi:hypothetical protein
VVEVGSAPEESDLEIIAALVVVLPDVQGLVKVFD